MFTQNNLKYFKGNINKKPVMQVNKTENMEVIKYLRSNETTKDALANDQLRIYSDS